MNFRSYPCFEQILGEQNCIIQQPYDIERGPVP